MVAFRIWCKLTFKVSRPKSEEKGFIIELISLIGGQTSYDIKNECGIFPGNIYLALGMNHPH